MLMRPGSSFAGVDGIFYSASKGTQDIPQPAIRQALMFGWTPVESDSVVLTPNLAVAPVQASPEKPAAITETQWESILARVEALESR